MFNSNWEGEEIAADVKVGEVKASDTAYKLAKVPAVNSRRMMLTTKWSYIEP